MNVAGGPNPPALPMYGGVEEKNYFFFAFFFAEKDAGTYEARFDASGLSSGVYFYRLQASPAAGGQTPILQVRKMLLVK